MKTPFISLIFAGLTFGVAWRVPDQPEKCNGDDLCNWMIENLGNTFRIHDKGKCQSDLNKNSRTLRRLCCFDED